MAKKKRSLARLKKSMKLFEPGHNKKLGLPPGTPVLVGAPAPEFTPYATLIQYIEHEYTETAAINPDQIAASLLPGQVNWIDVEGVHDLKLVQKIAGQLDLHALTLEDIVNLSLRPQFESYPGYFFFALKMLYLNTDCLPVQEHVSLILKGNTVISFQEKPGDVFGRVRDRIRSQTGKVRSRGADYLVYMLLDSIVDGYYQVVDKLAGQIEALEDEMRFGPRDEHLTRIYELKREILFFRKAIYPVRDLLSKAQVEGSVFQENTRIYLKDLNDHITQVTESVALCTEMVAVLLESYHSMMNQRMNAIMKTLTMISTVFLPLNFIAGIYGMNFHHMPELEWEYAYPLVLFIMMVVAIIMLWVFSRRGWIFESRAAARAKRETSASEGGV
jgi:magnesium transporter